ncbi:MAG TPA: AbrB/MazE/SpoVT family DNA-binding domain-containing protein [Tichowtungia sp.]|nr:AbrB/MazE/SpoVT family DNA-binding domain-containing protein [Tichowtungia sp.]
MISATVSPKFQVVIPRPVREEIKLRPGTKMQVIAYGNRIEFIPIKPMKTMRSFLKGIDTDVQREKEDRL